MVCIYCGQETQVANSRLQRRTNQVWRRRKCLHCKAVFSTHEQAVYEAAWRVKGAKSGLHPFVREKLFLSLHKSCEHRPTAVTDAAALTDTVIARLRPHIQSGLMGPNDIVREALTTLRHFDKAAAVHYQAFHS